MSVVYFIQAGAGGPIKIGVANDIERRICALQTGSPEPLVVLATIEGNSADERRLHQHLRSHRYRGEWFKPAPAVLNAVAAAKEGRFPDWDTVAASGRYFSHLNNLVELVRVKIQCRGVSRTRLAIAAGLHPNTLLNCEDEAWNPCLKTLFALERVLLTDPHAGIDEAEAA